MASSVDTNDLSFLSDLPLTRLALGNLVEDLTPLSSMSQRQELKLSLAHARPEPNDVLSPLAALPNPN